jgi:hypothetical protein
MKPLAVCPQHREDEIKEWIKVKKVCAEQDYDLNDIWLIVPVTINPEVFEV